MKNFIISFTNYIKSLYEYTIKINKAIKYIGLNELEKGAKDYQDWEKRNLEMDEKENNGIFKLQTTKEFEVYLRELYERIRPMAERDNIYYDLPINFVNGRNSPPGSPGSYCYVDEKGYNTYGIGDRGELYESKPTFSLFNISYRLLKHPISMMSGKYEVHHRIEGQDFRRVMFAKELELWNEIGEEYKKRAEDYIALTLKRNPYNDSFDPTKFIDRTKNSNFNV